ncbi:Serine/threonine-protein phosphatase 2A 55 kDa regulatory subunit B [Fasciola hepatica]|uniref:Serine/threonine-protein phosphatase 2A 55 kDa regulatory subunit B n=1 Tax=Fasciola hepatica TaxID=6192 RepID=A0A4E0R8V7_FASHE|nr:Serine/threonine-protein phosphatase 2A 55 kDa regulatory subunit B [Fasciola hepatica]
MRRANHHAESGSSTEPPLQDQGWYFNQIKGTCAEVNDADIISCVEYDKTGEFLATGDRGGRIVIFQRDIQQKPQIRVNHNVYCTFVSHEPEFDYLKSLEIEEKINKIRWLPRTNNARFLLSTNDKTIKLWRITERHKRATGYNLTRDQLSNSDSLDDPNSYSNHLSESMNNHPIRTDSSRVNTPRFCSPADLRVPRFEDIEPTVEAIPRRVFANAHAYLINSLSVNSDQETFLSADDLRINLWNLQITDQSFNIVDIKPNNMEDLSEVITAAQFHPSACSLFVYSSSKGTARLCDMRERALCDKHAATFEETDDPRGRSFFSEVINNISDVSFSHSGRYILTRDYLTVKVWDLNMPYEPVETYLVHEYLRTKLCSLYENDCIFDKFECQWSPDDRYIMTGSYNNHFSVFDRYSNHEVLLEASREVMESSPVGKLRPRKVVWGLPLAAWSEDKISVESMDFNRKLLHMSWHPHENSVALAGTSTLYLIDYYPELENGDTSKTGMVVMDMQDAEVEEEQNAEMRDLTGLNRVDAAGDITTAATTA